MVKLYFLHPLLISFLKYNLHFKVHLTYQVFKRSSWLLTVLYIRHVLKVDIKRSQATESEIWIGSIINIYEHKFMKGHFLDPH